MLAQTAVLRGQVAGEGRAVIPAAKVPLTGSGVAPRNGEAARLLGIHVNNLHRLLRELDLKSALKTGCSVDAKASYGQL